MAISLLIKTLMPAGQFISRLELNVLYYIHKGVSRETGNRGDVCINSINCDFETLHM